MNRTFAAIKTAAETATSTVELYEAVKEANEKLYRNIARAKLMSYTHGMAADADHYFQNVIPGWQKTVDEINTIWCEAVAGKPAQEIVAIIMAAR